MSLSLGMMHYDSHFTFRMQQSDRAGSSFPPSISSVLITLFFSFPPSLPAPIPSLLCPPDSPFFSAPFLDFKSVFQSSYYEGKWHSGWQWNRDLSCLDTNNPLETEQRGKGPNACCMTFYYCMATSLQWLGVFCSQPITSQPLGAWQHGMPQLQWAGCCAGWFKDLIWNAMVNALLAAWLCKLT